MEAAWQQRGPRTLVRRVHMQRQLHRKGLQRRPVRGPQQALQQELQSTRRQGQRSPSPAAGPRSAPALEPMRSKGQAQVPSVSWPWIQSYGQLKTDSSCSSPLRLRTLDHVQIAPLGAAVLSRHTNTGEPALRSIRRSRDRLTGTTTIECCGVRCLYPPRLVPTRKRTGRFLTVVAHPINTHSSKRLHGPRRSKTEPGRQAWRFTPLQRIPHPGRSPGNSLLIPHT